MEPELLTPQELLTMSRLSETAIGGFVKFHDDVIPMVAMADWIMPKQVFVTLWIWYMLDAKVYAKHFENKHWDTILYELNKNTIYTTPRLANVSSNWVHCIHNHLCYMYKKHNWSVEQKRDIFEQVINSLKHD